MRKGRSYYKRKMYFDREDRILLHLLEFAGYETQRERPDALTQFGLADATMLGRSTISKSIRLLIDRGLIVAERAHVPSGKLRRTTYLLTQAGARLARSRKEEVEGEIIAVRGENGDITRMPLKQIARQLPASASTLSIAVHVNRGVFDMKSFQRGQEKRQAFVDFTERAPKLKYFFGRIKELDEVDKFLASRESKFLALSGIPGIGKTTLLVRRLEDWRRNTNLFWYRVQEWSASGNVLRRLAQFLDCLGRRELSNYLATGNGLDMEEVSRLLEKDLKGLDALLIFDDCHKASKEITQLLYSLKLVLDGLPGPKVIVAGRSVPAFYDRRDAKVRRLVKEFEIQGLDKDSSARLLALRSVDIQHPALDRIFEATGGHPLFLELVDPAQGTRTKDIVRYLDEDLAARLSRPELSILEVASVFRYPVAPQALLFAQEADMGNLRFLIDQNLLRETTLNLFEIHDLLKDFFRGRMTPARRRRYEQRAAMYHLSLGTSENLLEAVHHMLEAGDERDAAKLLAGKGKDIAKQGHTVELDAYLRRLERVKMAPEVRLDLMLLRGDALSSLGEWEKALEVRARASRLAGERGELGEQAAALKAMGDIYVRRNEWDEAMRVLTSSLSIYKRLDDVKGRSAVHYAIGMLNESFGHLDKALKHFRRAARLIGPRDDPEGLVQYLSAYSRVLVAKGENEKALKLMREALDVAQTVGNLHEIAKATVAVGVGLMHNNRLEDGLEKCREGINLARRIGNARILGYGLMNAASALVRTRSAGLAEANLAEAMKIFEKLGEKVPLGMCRISVGFVEESRGDWEGAKAHLRAGLRTLRDDHSPLDLLNSTVSAAVLFAKHGERKEASQLFSSSRSIARRLGRDDMVRFADAQLTALKQGRAVRLPGSAVPG